MGLFHIFNVVAILYALFAVGVLVKIFRNGRATFDNQFTPTDRRLAGAAAFYLGAPIAVGLHELGHAVALWACGGEVADWHFMFYWGYVEPAPVPPLSPLQHAIVAFTGNAVSLAIGFGAILWTLRQPINAAWNFTRLELARILLWLTLGFYPVLSLLLDSWDFAIMRRQLNEVVAYGGDVAMIAYGGFAYWVFRKWRGPWRRRYLRLATPLFDRMNAAGDRVTQDPNDVAALRELARAFLSGDEARGAVGPLERALEIDPDAPETHYLAGLTSLRLGQPHQAAAHLRDAGNALEQAGPPPDQADLYFEVMLGLAAARLLLSDTEGALLTVEAADGQRPGDPRVLLLHADALEAAGRLEEARARLKRALEGAQGRFAAEIRRRLRALR